MIDIHCHLLPNIDDGSGSWEESLQMVEIALQDGITGAVATPHWIQGTTWQPHPDSVRALVAEFNEKIAERGLDFLAASLFCQVPGPFPSALPLLLLALEDPRIASVPACRNVPLPCSCCRCSFW